MVLIGTVVAKGGNTHTRVATAEAARSRWRLVRGYNSLVDAYRGLRS